VLADFITASDLIII